MGSGTVRAIFLAVLPGTGVGRLHSTPPPSAANRIHEDWMSQTSIWCSIHSTKDGFWETRGCLNCLLWCFRETKSWGISLALFGPAKLLIRQLYTLDLNIWSSNPISQHVPTTQIWATWRLSIVHLYWLVYIHTDFELFEGKSLMRFKNIIYFFEGIFAAISMIALIDIVTTFRY